MDLVSLGLAAAKYVAPYLLALTHKTAEAAGKRTSEFIVDKTLEGAKDVWNRLTEWYKDDHAFISLGDYLESSGVNETSQQMLATEIATRLEKDPDKAAQLQKLLGGDAAINSIIAGEESVAERIRQTIKGGGKNLLDLAKKAKASDIVQEIENK